MIAPPGPDEPGTDIARVEKGPSAEEGFHFPTAREQFPAWDDIYTKVQEEFTRVSKVHEGGHRALAEEEQYYKLVAEAIDGHPDWAPPRALPELAELLRRYQFGYGAIQDYLEMEGIEEVYFNSFRHGFYKRDGRKFAISPPIFATEKEMRDLADRIAEENGLSIDLSHPVLDARLRDGSRLNVIIPPLARRGTSLVIRKHREIPITIDDYLRTGLLTEECAEDMEKLVVGGMRMIVSGGTASGKTTFLNVIGNAFIPPEDRLIICEDTPELQIETADTVYLATQKDATHDIRDEGEVSLLDLIRYTLRMRPDRIIVGEVRGKEALYVLVAWNTGHEGSFLTLHANSAIDALAKLEQLAVSAKEYDQPGVRDLIGRVVNIVIQVEEIKRGPERGQRRLKEMLQVFHEGNIPSYLREQFDTLKAEGKIKPMWEGACYILPLYERDVDGKLVKLADPLAQIGQEI